jgi:predicted ATPase
VGGEAGAESRRAPLVGRKQELAELLDTWAGVRSRREARVAMVLGDPGVGKTRLLEELVSRARLEGAAVAAVTAVSADRGEPWSGVLGLARGGLLDAAGLAATQPAALAAFAAQLPAWADRFGGITRGITPHSPGRALSEVLAALCEEQPVVLAADDAHWLDQDSVAALAGVLRDLADRPLLVVLGAPERGEAGALDQLRAHMGRDLRGASVRVGPLAQPGLQALARWALPKYTDEELERVTRRLAMDSAGLPLLAVEILHAVALGMDLDKTAGAWPQPFKTLDQTLPSDLPDAVVAAIRVGFGRLSADAKKALSAAAVLGDRVDQPTIARVTGIAGEPLDQALDELEWQRWLGADPRGYTFVARIVRDVVVRDMVTPGQRQRLLGAMHQ